MYCIFIYFSIVVATIDNWDARRESVPIHVGRMCQYNSSPLGDHKHEIYLQPTLPKSLLNLQMKYNIITNSKLILWSSSKEIPFITHNNKWLSFRVHMKLIENPNWVKCETCFSVIIHPFSKHIILPIGFIT